MMNRRPGVTARFASGAERRYLQAVQAAASHMYLGDGEIEDFLQRHRGILRLTIDMKTADKLTITRTFRLLDKQVLMVHVDSGDLDRSWLGLVDLHCNERAIRMRCVGVGETGGEPAVILRPAGSPTPTLEEVITTIGEPPACPLYLERATGERAA